MTATTWGELPRPDGYRGSGEPVWRRRGVKVSQTEPYNRADDAVPTVTICGISGGEWTLAAAEQFALAILAAVDWTAEAVTPPTTDAEWREHAGGFHVFYRGTACRHRLHVQQVRRCVGVCKWCAARCWCRCHGRFGLIRAVVRAAALAFGGVA